MCLKNAINMAYIIKIWELPKNFKKPYLKKTNFHSWVSRSKIKLRANQYAYSTKFTESKKQTLKKKKSLSLTYLIPPNLNKIYL